MAILNTNVHFIWEGGYETLLSDFGGLPYPGEGE